MLILLLVAVLSLPLCCAPAVPFVPYPVFAGRYNVVNESGERLYISPVAEIGRNPHFLVKYYSKFPHLPLLKRADVRMDPGESVRIDCMVVPDLYFSRIAVRNEGGEYRQLKVEVPAGAHAFGMPEKTYVIESFNRLRSISGEDLAFARKGRRFNFRAGGAVMLGLIPVALFTLLLGLAWMGWKERRRKGSNDV
jgi:hypothetical protein